MQDKASNGGRRGQKLFAPQAKTTFGHRKSDKRERIRNPLKRKTDCHAPNGARNDEGVRERIAAAVTRLRNDNSFILNVWNTNGKVEFIM